MLLTHVVKAYIASQHNIIILYVFILYHVITNYIATCIVTAAVDANEEFCVVLKTSLAGLRILLAAEVDCHQEVRPCA